MVYLWLNATNMWLSIRLVSAVLVLHGVSVAECHQQVARHQTGECSHRVTWRICGSMPPTGGSASDW